MVSSPPPEDVGERRASPSSASGKRKLVVPANGDNKRKRSRVSYSCSECHRRKQKCDRQQPCAHCISRRVPELCHAYQPGKGEGDLHLRLARVEHILEMALPQFAASGSPGGSVEPPQSSNNPHYQQEHPSPDSREESVREEEIPNAVGTLQQENGPFFGETALGSVNSTPILAQFHTPQMPQANEAELAVEKLRSLVQDCGVPPHTLEELVRELPPKSYCDDLIHHYFTAINWTRYPILEAPFRASYEVLISNGHRIHPLDIRFLPLLFIVLAIAAKLAPDHIISDERQRKMAGLRYYWSSRKSMMIAAAVGEGLDLVVARLMTARFLTFHRRITESWNILGTSVRTALALGLHRDGAKLGLDPIQVEYRRRIWAYIYHADRSYALVLGRPPGVQDEFSDTMPPTNAGDSFLLGQRLTPPRSLPLSQPTPMTFVILRHNLAKIIGRIVRHFQQVHPTHYSDVIALDEELQKFVETLPPHYSLGPDTTLDATHEFLAPHRFLIITEVFFVRVSLHRPYMLRKLDSDRFAYSRKACFESAKLDFQVRQAFKHSMRADIISCLGGAYREFQAAMISGISLVIDPHGPDAVTMHKILDTFLSDHVNTFEPDETTRREVKIIELLKTKSLSVAAGEPIHSPPSPKAELPGGDPDVHLSTIHSPAGLRHGVSSSEDANMLLEPPRDKNGALILPQFAANVSAVDLRGSPTTSGPVWDGRSLQAIRPESSGGSLDTGMTLPPSNSSPVDEEESAQRLLDNWVNSAQIDSVGNATFGLGGMDPNVPRAGNSWPLGIDGEAQLPVSRSDSLDGMIGGPAAGAFPAGADLSNGDWNYWENLVDHIRASGGVAY